MHVVAGGLARRVSAHTGYSADGEFLRGVKVVRSELSGVIHNQTQVFCQALKAARAEGHFVELAFGARRRRIARDERRGMQRQAALAEKRLKSGHRPVENGIAKVAATARLHRPNALLVHDVERAYAVYKLACFAAKLNSKIEVRRADDGIGKPAAPAARGAARLQRRKIIAQFVGRLRGVGTSTQPRLSERRLIGETQRLQLFAGGQDARAQAIADVERRVRGRAETQAIAAGEPAAAVVERYVVFGRARRNDLQNQIGRARLRARLERRFGLDAGKVRDQQHRALERRTVHERPFRHSAEQPADARFADVACVADVDALVTAFHHAHFHDAVAHVLRWNQGACNDVASLLVEFRQSLGERLNRGERHGAPRLAKQAQQLLFAENGGAGHAERSDEEGRRVDLRFAGWGLNADLRRRGLSRRLGNAQLFLNASGVRLDLRERLTGNGEPTRQQYHELQPPHFSPMRAWRTAPYLRLAARDGPVEAYLPKLERGNGSPWRKRASGLRANLACGEDRGEAESADAPPPHTAYYRVPRQIGR